MHREHEHGQIRVFRADRFRQLDPIRAAVQSDIHDREIDFRATQRVERPRAAFRLREHLQVWLLAQHLHHAFAEERVIVHHEDTASRRGDLFPFHHFAGITQRTSVPPRFLRSITNFPPSAFAR